MTKANAHKTESQTINEVQCKQHNSHEMNLLPQRCSSHPKAVTKPNQMGTKAYGSFLRHTRFHKHHRIHGNSIRMYSPTQKHTHLAAAARAHTNNPPTSFPGKSFKASEHYNPTAKSKSNPPTQSEINKATSPNDHTRKLTVTAPRTHAANLSEAAGSDEEEELTGEAADRPVMRQNMAARWREARDPHQI